MLLLLRGEGEETSGPTPLRFPASSLMFVPAVEEYRFDNTGPGDSRLLVISNPPADVRSTGSPPRRLGPVSWPRLPAVELGLEAGFAGVRSTLAVTGEEPGATNLLFGVSRFAPGGRHDLHRHRHAAEVMYVIEGDGCYQFGEGGWSEPLDPGASTLIPAGEWHGLTNRGGATATVAFAYLGAATIEDDGYELFAA